MNRPDILILYSGGLDSRIMWELAKRQYTDNDDPRVHNYIKAVYYAHGADSEAAEIASLPSFVEVKKVEWLGDKIQPVAKNSDPFAGNIYIPGRNGVFANLAACQYLPKEIWMGTLWDENHPDATDKNDEFIATTAQAINYMLKPFLPFGDGIKIRFPFSDRKWTKVEAVRWFKDTVSDAKEQIVKTTSCWHNTGKACGRCKQCVKRFLVLFMNGIYESYDLPVGDCPLHTIEGIAIANAYLQKFFYNFDSLNLDEINVARMILYYMKQNNLDVLEI